MLMLGGPKIMKLFSWCALWEQQLTMGDFSTIEKAAATATTSHNHVRCWMEEQKLQKSQAQLLKKRGEIIWL